MNVIELLKEQHREVKELLEKLMAVGDRRQRRATLGEFAKAYRLHSRLEEKSVYPAAARALQSDAEQERILLAYEEHGAAERALAALEATPPGDKRFSARTKVLRMLVQEHISDEETKVLPAIESKLQPSGIERLSGQVERRLTQLQQELEQRPPPRSKAMRVAARAPAKKAALGGSRRQPVSRAIASARGARAEPRSSGRGRSGTRGAPVRAPRRGESKSGA